jgi:non-canonical poly(A) RNA polymerase PAPD5/7
MASAPGIDSYRPQYDANAGPPLPPADVQRSMYEFQGNQREGRRAPPRGGEFTFRHGSRPKISERPLLTKLRGSSPDRLFTGDNGAEKFRQVDHLTDSDEEEIDLSQSDDGSGPRPNKRLRSGPAWSNPDPYTALPPVADTQKKNKDVVKMIRKSRVTPPAQAGNNVLANGEDFISFDLNYDRSADGDQARYEPPPNAPTGPKTQPTDSSTQLGKRKRDALDDGGKLPPRAKKGARLHQRGEILQEWQASDSNSSTPWYRPPPVSDVLPGIA